jgi:transcriptional regulator with XRE-family HTH domain
MAEMSNSRNPLRTIRETLGLSEKQLARKIDRTPQHVSRVERGSSIPVSFANELRNYVQKSCSPDECDQIFKLLEGRLPVSKELFDVEATSRQKRDWEPNRFVPVEQDSWSWALAFRNSALLEELAGHAIQCGVACTRVRDGVVLPEGVDVPLAPNRAGSSLFVQPETFGLHPGTVVLLGASMRHSHARKLLWEFNDKLQLHIDIREFPERPAYFAYPTVLKYLSVEHDDKQLSFRPERYAEGDSLVYKDVAAVFHGPLADFFSDEQRFGHGVRRFVWVAALQRLANGVAVRLLRDPGFRQRYLPDYDFEKDGQVGVVVFEVTVVHSGIGTRIQDLRKRVEHSRPVALDTVALLQPKRRRAKK